MTATDNSLFPVPQWKLERFVLGELPAAELASLGQRLLTDADLQRQVDALKAADADIRKSYPAPWMARQIRARAEGVAGRDRAGSRWSLTSWTLSRMSVARWLAPVAAVALLVIVAVPMLRDGEGPETVRFLEEGVRSKGDGATLYAHRRTPDGTERLQDGSSARRGDLVRLQYDGAGAAYGAILSIDGRGTVTRHLPTEGDTAARLTVAGIVSLDVAYELDDAPRWERFFLVTASQPFSVDEIAAAARAASAATQVNRDAPERLELPESLAQSALTLIKVEASADEEER
jgi:hypothetical protein